MKGENRKEMGRERVLLCLEGNKRFKALPLFRKDKHYFFFFFFDNTQTYNSMSTSKLLAAVRVAERQALNLDRVD